MRVSEPGARLRARDGEDTRARLTDDGLDSRNAPVSYFLVTIEITPPALPVPNLVTASADR